MRPPTLESPFRTSGKQVPTPENAFRTCRKRLTTVEGYSFTPPAVIPETRNRLSTKKKTTTGTDTMSAPAA